MKKILLFCTLYFIAVLAYAETCPEIGGGYEFRVAAWGDHKKHLDFVRCHYYFRDSSGHKEILSSRQFYESEILRHSGWNGDMGDHYHLCTSYPRKVNDCSFG